jgi:hypothetical protein
MPEYSESMDPLETPGQKVPMIHGETQEMSDFNKNRSEAWSKFCQRIVEDDHELAWKAFCIGFDEGQEYEQSLIQKAQDEFIEQEAQDKRDAEYFVAAAGIDPLEVKDSQGHISFEVEFWQRLDNLIRRHLAFHDDYTVAELQKLKATVKEVLG